MTDGWTQTAAIATAASAVATAASAAFIAWQAAETRRATRTAQGSLLAAQATALDAARARLDNQAPRVELNVEMYRWPPYTPSESGGKPQPWPAGTTWHLPRDGRQRLLVSVLVNIANHSDRHVHLAFGGDLHHSNEQLATEDNLIFAETKNFPLLLQSALTIAEWAQNAEAVGKGEEPPHIVRGTVTARDDRDQGVTDIWDLSVTACPIEPDPNLQGVWRVSQTLEGRPTSVKFDMHPSYRRTYWLSRGGAVALPDPLYAPVAPLRHWWVRYLRASAR
jgi:hypothetical protein